MHQSCIVSKLVKWRRLEILWSKETHIIRGIELRTSGFYTLVGHLVREIRVVCVGASSGCIYTGPTTSGPFWKGWDNPGIGTPWDLSNDSYAGLNQITGGKILFPQFNANWKSLAPEKPNELNHIIVMIDESTAFTAETDGDTSSSVASSTPTSPTSQARKRERPSLSSGRPFPALRVPTPFFDWTAPRTSGAPGFQCLRFSRPQPFRCAQRLEGVSRFY